MYPVSKAVLFDGIEQRLFFPAGPPSLRLGTPERESPAVHQLVTVPSAVVTDLCTGREALRTQLDVGTLRAAKPQVCDIRKAVNAVLFPQVGHVVWLLLLVVEAEVDACAVRASQRELLTSCLLIFICGL